MGKILFGQSTTGNGYVDSLNAAIEKCNKLINLNGKDDKAYYQRANAKYALALYSENHAPTKLQIQANFKEAIKDYKEVTQLNSKYSDTAYYNMGLSRGKIFHYHVSDEVFMKTDEFEKAIELNPKYAGAYYMLGYWTMEIRVQTLGTENKKYNKAIDAFTKAIELAPNKYVARAYMYRGDCKVNLVPKDKDGACADWLKANELGESGGRDRAINMLGFGSCDFVPKTADDFFAVGSYKLRDSKEAIPYFLKAIELNPKHGTAYYYLGYCYSKQKNKVAACEAWKKAQELGNKDAAEYLRKKCE